MRTVNFDLATLTIMKIKKKFKRRGWKDSVLECTLNSLNDNIPLMLIYTKCLNLHFIVLRQFTDMHNCRSFIKSLKTYVN